MNESKTVMAQCGKTELEIEIAAPRGRVWKAIFEDINFWWLPDFHMAGEGSVVTLDPKPGGRGLVEDTPDGGGLQWYSVQMDQPSEFKVYLVGHIAPDWGGPVISSLKLALEKTSDGCVLKISDARHGNICEDDLQCTQDGWRSLFTDGLKRFVESKE